MLHEDTHFWSWTGKQSWLWIFLKVNGYILGKQDSGPHHQGRGESSVGRTWLDCLSELCWRQCGASCRSRAFGFVLKWKHFGKMFTWLLSELWTMTLLSPVCYCLWLYDREAVLEGQTHQHKMTGWTGWMKCMSWSSWVLRQEFKRKVGWMAGPHVHNRIRTITQHHHRDRQSSLFLFSCFLFSNITNTFLLGLKIKY